MPDLWLLFAPIKRGRIDWLVEKATELGVARLVPVVTRRTIVDRLNLERLRAHAIEAAEQCERTALPELAEPRKLDALLERLAGRPHALFRRRGRRRAVRARARPRRDPDRPRRRLHRRGARRDPRPARRPARSRSARASCAPTPPRSPRSACGWRRPATGRQRGTIETRWRRPRAPARGAPMTTRTETGGKDERLDREPRRPARHLRARARSRRERWPIGTEHEKFVYPLRRSSRALL